MREAWLSALQFDLPGARVLDLFAGSGALGFEALSRGAAHVTFVDHAPAALRTIKENAGALGASDDELDIVRGDALRFAAALERLTYDIALADPPYKGGFGMRLAAAFAVTPFARVLAIEHARAEPVTALPAARTRLYGDTAITYIPAET